MPPDVFELLLESFRRLDSEAPEAAQALKRAAATVRVRLSTEGRARVVASRNERWALHDGGEAADVEIVFDREVVLDLAEARLSLDQALVGERLGVVGEIGAVERLYEALTIYLEGLMRAPGAAHIYRRYCGQ